MCRCESEDKKEYMNELSKQQFDMAASTHYTTNRSQVHIRLLCKVACTLC